MTAPSALAGRVGVVTGASSGIGAAIAGALADAGMAVVLGARRTALLDDVCAAIRAGGGRAESRATDMRDESQVEALVAMAVERFGRLDTLVNNAATATLRTVAEGRTEEWRATLETNVLGVLVACRAALHHMLPRGAGDIVYVSSASIHGGWPFLAAYAASKAALQSLSASLRAEVAASGVRVMTIEVHNVTTRFAEQFDPALLPDAVRRWAELGLINPDAPLLEPSEVAAAVVFQLARPPHASVHTLTLRSRTN